MGGLIKALQAASALIVYPVSHFLFMFIMVKRFFLAKTADDSLFLKQNKGKKFYLDEDKIPEKLKGTTFVNDIKNNRAIDITTCEKFLLMVHYYIPFLMKISCWKKRYSLVKMIDKGIKKVQKNLNMKNIQFKLNELQLINFQ